MTLSSYLCKHKFSLKSSLSEEGYLILQSQYLELKKQVVLVDIYGPQTENE